MHTLRFRLFSLDVIILQMFKDFVLLLLRLRLSLMFHARKISCGNVEKFLKIFPVKTNC